MKVLIAGGFGFIGGRLGELLLQNGHEVLLGSRFIRTVSGVLSQASVVQTDWYSEKSLDHICKEVDVIVHASGMNAEECFDDPVEALEVNKGYVEKLMMTFSTGGADQDTYKKMFGKDQFFQVKENINNFLQSLKQKNLQIPVSIDIKLPNGCQVKMSECRDVYNKWYQ